jgi:hypothetical protein
MIREKRISGERNDPTRTLMVDRKGHSADYPGTLWINRRHSNDHTHVRRQKERFGEFLNISHADQQLE